MVGTLETRLDEPIHFSEPTIKFRMEIGEKLKQFRLPWDFVALPTTRMYEIMKSSPGSLEKDLDEFKDFRKGELKQKIIDIIRGGIVAVKPDFRSNTEPNNARFFTFFFDSDLSVWGTFYIPRELLSDVHKDKIPQNSNLYLICAAHKTKNRFGSFYDRVVDGDIDIPDLMFYRKRARMLDLPVTGSVLIRSKDEELSDMGVDMMYTDLHILNRRGTLLPMSKYD